MFHFKDRDDPDDNTISVRDAAVRYKRDTEGRMTSPVILKPWAVSEREAVPLVAVLRSRGIERLRKAGELRLWQKNERDEPVSLGERDAVAELVQMAEARFRARAFQI